MMHQINHMAGDRFGPLLKPGLAPDIRSKIPGLELWHSKLVHVEDILNFDDFVDEKENPDTGFENIHFLI